MAEFYTNSLVLLIAIDLKGKQDNQVSIYCNISRTNYDVKF